MKIKAVPITWVIGEQHRFDCGPFTRGGIEAKKTLESLRVPKSKLVDVTLGGMSGMYHVGMDKLRWVDGPEYGVPFLRSADILRADLSDQPYISRVQVLGNPLFTCPAGTTLITRSGTIGRMAYCREDMAQMGMSQDVLKVVPDQAKIPSGYLYAFLSSKYGVPLIVNGTFGSIIVHIERENIAELPVPRFAATIEQRAHRAIERAAVLRAQYQQMLVGATMRLLAHVGIQEQTSDIWYGSGQEVGFEARVGVSHSFRASNYSPRVRRLLDHLRRLPHRTLGAICTAGHLGTGARFKRIDCDPALGVKLIGQRQGFWMRPEGRWISARRAPPGIFAVDETVMIASSGTLGENELYCRPIFVTGRWLEYAFTQHFLRVVPGDGEISGSYLFAFLRSELAFRCLRSMSTGSKQQEIHQDLISAFPVPILDDQARGQIERAVREAFLKRDEADRLEDEAVALVEHAIEEAA